MGIERAGQYGIESPQDVATFVALLFEISPHFFQQAQIHAILGNPAIAAERKMEIVMDRTTDVAWDEASLQSKEWPI